MPDDADYAWLGELLADPERWTEDNLASVRMLIANQQRALAELHSNDRSGKQSAQAVVDALAAALRTYFDRRG